MDPDNFRKRVWKRAMEKSGLRRRRTTHAMRRTYATLRLSKGDPQPIRNREQKKDASLSAASFAFW
ncbi:MAG: hypothetical protein WHS86_07390 [Desulfosoma sp.]